jgi:hypothetical protein
MVPRSRRPSVFHLLLAALVCLACLAPTASRAEPVQWAENGHWYELVDQIVSWEEAEALAESMYHLGVQGHLATLTTVAENDFVWLELVSDQAYTPLGDPWLGGYQNPVASPPDENWHWVTEEAWDWTNWSWGEPNDYCEPYGEMYLQFAGCCGGAWNDHHSEVPKAFIVEYSGDIVVAEEKSWSEVKALFR